MEKIVAAAAAAILMSATPTFAQLQPVFVPAPPGPEFFPRYEFAMSVDSLSPPKDTPEQQADTRFSWDTHFGGSFDVVDLVYGRAGAIVDFEAVEGSEYRPFDPNQGNYTLEAFVLGRVGKNEIGVIFHHVSRHLSDRPKIQAVAWNELGGRFLRRFAAGGSAVDLDVEGGRAVQHSYVDYTWIGDVALRIVHPINAHVGLFAGGNGRFIAVDDTVTRRGAQTGARVEGGVQLYGRGGIMEIYAGYENRIDAYPLDRVPQRWAIVGLRVRSR